MEAGNGGDTINPWAVALFRSLQLAKPTSASEQAAYGKWLDQTSDREEGRRDRLHGAEGVVPASIWLVLILIAGSSSFSCCSSPTAPSARARRRCWWVGDGRDRADADGDRRARQPVPGRDRADQAGRDGAFAADPRQRARAIGNHGAAAVRQPRRSGRVVTDDAKAPFDRRFELAATVLLTLAAVATAWAAYQAARWRGEQAGPRAPRSLRASSRRARRTWPTARGRSTSRCSPSGSMPTRATRPSSRPSTAGASARSSSRRSTPGSRPSRERTRTLRCRRSRCRSTSWPRPRRPTARGEGRRVLPARRPLHRARGQLLAGRRAVRGVLFFAGIGTRLTSPQARIVMLAFGYVLFIGTVIWLATLPETSVSV